MLNLKYTFMKIKKYFKKIQNQYEQKAFIFLYKFDNLVIKALTHSSIVGVFFIIPKLIKGNTTYNSYNYPNIIIRQPKYIQLLLIFPKT